MSIIDILKENFGYITVYRGDDQILLGMNIKEHKDKKIEIEKKDQLWEEIGEIFEGEDSSTAANHLSKVNKDSFQLDDRKSDIFHSVTENLLFISKISQPDKEHKVAFLCTLVSKSDEEDWNKLKIYYNF